MSHPPDTSTEYEQLLEKLTGLLRAERRPTSVLWVFREDLVCLGGRLFVCLPVPRSNQSEVVKAMQTTRARELGVEAQAFAILDDEVLCNIHVPEDQREAESLMIGGLKARVRLNMLRAKGVSPMRWRLLRLLERNRGLLWDISSREPGADADVA